MLGLLVTASLTAAPPLDVVYVPDPRGDFVTVCRSEGETRSARRVIVWEQDGRIVRSEAPREVILTAAEVERLRQAIFDRQELGEDLARYVSWRRDAGWEATLVSDVERMDEGTFVAIDAGKWGGGLMWLTQDSVRSIFLGPMHAIARDGDVVLVAEGNHHGFGGPGSLLRVITPGGRPEIDVIYDLPGTLRDVAVGGGLIVMASEFGPIVIDEEGILHRRATNHTGMHDDRQDRRHPDSDGSVAIDADGAVHVGLAGGYAIYRDLPGSFAYEYYALTEPCADPARPD